MKYRRSSSRLTVMMKRAVFKKKLNHELDSLPAAFFVISSPGISY